MNSDSALNGFRTRRLWMVPGLALACAAGCATATSEKPRLAVVVVVDMFPAEHFEHYRKHFGPDGFNRLMRDGAWMTNASYGFASTVTGCGHATIATGADPIIHGIVENEWYDRETSQKVLCDDGPEFKIIGTEDAESLPGASPRMLAAATLGDAVKRHGGAGAKVWSISLKSRGAVMMAGQAPDGAIWWDVERGNYVTSTYYADNIPDWCLDLNRRRYADKYFELEWERAAPLSAYDQCDIDDATYETGNKLFWANTFPKNMRHPIPGPSGIYYARVQMSPFGNDVAFEAARGAVVNEKLGADDTPDLLTVSLSSVDFAGHLFGPDSHEMLDMMIRTDREMADWLKFLDEKVGKNRYVIAVTGDHGAGSAPEYAELKGMDNGRIRIRDFYDVLNGALRAEFGTPDDGVYYLTAVDPPWAYLNEKILTDRNIDVARAAEIVTNAARGHAGIEAAFVTADLAGKPANQRTQLESAVVKSTHGERSGQVFIQMKPNWYLAGVCAGHGSFHSCDTHVPVFFMGDAFRKGRFDDAVDITDFAPTLSAAIGMAPPSSATGKALTSVLRVPVVGAKSNAGTTAR